MSNIKEAILQHKTNQGNWAIFWFNRRKKQASIQYYTDHELEVTMDLPLSRAKEMYNEVLKDGYEVFK